MSWKKGGVCQCTTCTAFIFVMGPDVPSRPKFSWDVGNVPWADGKGDQDQYKNSVLLWKAFHDRLPEANSNKIPGELQGIALQSQLYGRALDLSKKIPSTTIQSIEGASQIVKAVYKRDPLAVIRDVDQTFQQVMSTKRGLNESFKNFESRFEAQVSKYNSLSTESQLPNALVTFMLLSNANVDSSQRVSVLAAAAPRRCSALTRPPQSRGTDGPHLYTTCNRVRKSRVTV